ncbi:uracil-DNA glycosylase (plasmid) [Halorussus limi]|uniref:Uracil-DNA glycosylase n=1 Tax=Halorussus limi TaxID=2938695 RepID=A0A8U0HZ33_9EURY|nr:uracil-DNA glycosylase family protein [Halorussus limi]UPV76395.1 uracil-DNA glycosylase [Halorussus limi]
MKNVTDRTSNPFGMRPPCRHECDSGVSSVFGYGDANADFHLVGDYPGVHGGRETGVPFTGSVAGERLQPVLNEVGLVGDAYSDEPAVADLFLSYRHACCLPEGSAPTEDDYDRLEPFFDAELRAIAAHVLLPVGERATRHVLRTYAAREALLDAAGDSTDGEAVSDGDRMADLHGDHVPGRGFLVVPVREPTEWEAGDGERLASSLSDLRATDYRQTADLGRFLAEHDTYEVR